MSTKRTFSSSLNRRYKLPAWVKWKCKNYFQSIFAAVAHELLPVVRCELPVVRCELPVVRCELQVDRQLVVRRELLIAMSFPGSKTRYCHTCSCVPSTWPSLSASSAVRSGSTAVRVPYRSLGRQSRRAQLPVMLEWLPVYRMH